MDHLPIRQVQEITGHAVRSIFYATGVADAGLETGDPGLLDAARRLYESVTLRKMYITGAVGTQEKDEGFGPDYDLPNQGGYGESCAACGMIYFSEAMHRHNHDRDSMDVIEKTLYNTVLHGISLDGTNTYYRNPLTDDNHARDNCWVCCPPCLSRTLLRMPGYVFSHSTNCIYVNLFVGSSVSITLGGHPVRVTQQTEYPWQGTVKITCAPEQAGRFKLALRRPGWCDGFHVSVNGLLFDKWSDEKGYAVIDREWRAGDQVELQMSMPVMRMQADPRVQACQGQVALQRGPIVYGVEGVDNNGHTDIVLLAQTEFTADFRPALLNGVVVINGKASNGTPFTAVPFYSLANRGASRQAVWLKQEDLTNNPSGWKKLYRPISSR
jgi:DUF1680 family protein